MGESVANSVVTHQWKQRGAFPTSGISTSPLFERARYYALHDRQYDSGRVLEFDVSILTSLGVSAYRVADYVPFPAVPEDDEFILVAPGGGLIPESAVVACHDVSAA